MKRMVSLFVAFALSVGTPLFAEQTKTLNQVTGSLTVLVSGLKNSKGEVRIALSDSKKNYETKGAEPFRRIVSAITNLTAQGGFEKLPLGEYAIKVVHDENENGKLDTNFLGIPKEDYAFSGKSAGFGSPSFERAKLKFSENMTVRIVIREK